MNGLADDIDRIRKEWGRRLLILGHHYQRSDVLRHADAIGDSLELAKQAAAHPEAERIVFCGVRFMAESADILTGPGQTVYMPDSTAGCPMADMADARAASAAWEFLQGMGGDWLPIVYVNSSAEIKAWCGRNGGSTCTSSNARRAFEWAFRQNRRVFFLPDEHLGVNTAHDLGIPDEAVGVYDPRAGRQTEAAAGGPGPGGGLTPGRIGGLRVIVWKGFCLVHTAFTVEHLREARARFPAAKVIVHPETPKAVTRLADAHGSTSQIIAYVQSAAPGSTILIGTEQCLVQRLAETHRGKLTIKALWPSLCANMQKTNPHNLLEVLTGWPRRNEVHVPDDVAEEARKALRRMLEI